MQTYLPRLVVSPETLAVVGPGPNAIHTPVFHQPDADHLNCEYGQLRERWPSIEWIGSLHVHPYGMPYLSGHDRNTLDRLFDDPLLRLTEFIAGIMQRRGGRLAIYPYVISTSDRLPWLVPVEIVSSQSDVWREAEQTAKKSRQVINALSPTRTVRGRFWRRLTDIGSISALLMRRFMTRNPKTKFQENTYE